MRMPRPPGLPATPTRPRPDFRMAFGFSNAPGCTTTTARATTRAHHLLFHFRSRNRLLEGASARLVRLWWSPRRIQKWANRSSIGRLNRATGRRMCRTGIAFLRASCAPLAPPRVITWPHRRPSARRRADAVGSSRACRAPLPFCQQTPAVDNQQAGPVSRRASPLSRPGASQAVRRNRDYMRRGQSRVPARDRRVPTGNLPRYFM